MKTYSDCMEVREDFSAYLDGELGVEAREGLEAHLAGCAECLREMDHFKRVDDAYRSLPAVAAPATFEQGVREAMQSGGSKAGVRGPVPRWMGPLVAMATAASVLIVGMLVMEWRQAGQAKTQMAAATPTVIAESSGQALMKSSETADSAARAAAPAQPGGGWDSFAQAPAAAEKKEASAPAPGATADGDGAWENFAKSPTDAASSAADAAAEPTLGGREDVGDALAQGLADEAAPESRARSEVIGTPPAAPKAEKPAEKVLDAQGDAAGEAVPPPMPEAGAPAGEVVSRQTLRSFRVLPGPLWVEDGYDHQETVKLKRDSKELRELMKKFPAFEWNKVLERDARQVFQMGDTWYDLEATAQQ